MAENRRPVSCREGKVFVDGVRIFEAVKFEAHFTPEVAEGRCLGDRTKSRRYLGQDIVGSMTEFKTTQWYTDIARRYQETGVTPEFTIQGIQDDKNSDYYDEYGSDTITLTGCVITSDIPLITLDEEGEFVQHEIEFSARRMI